MTLKIVGLDIGRSSAIACVMTEPPADLGAFIRKYKPRSFKATPEILEELTSLGDIFALEPTGADHRWWKQQLEASGKQVFLCAGTRIRNFARNQGIANKGDKEDAAAIALYTWHNLERGNLRAFQKHAGNELNDLRRGLLNCQHQRTKLISQLKSRLAVEAPEKCKLRATLRKWGQESRPFWKLLQQTPGLSWQTQEDIEQIIYWDNRECRLENEISAILETPEYAVYRRVQRQWNFSERVIVAIAAATHPIEQFLTEDGRRIIERQYNASGNRVKLDRSVRGIHRCLGYGRIKIQSGDTWKWARTGDRTILGALYLWIEMMVSIRRTPSTQRLVKVFPNEPLPEDPAKRKAWIEAHNFRAFCIAKDPRCETVKPITRKRQREGFLPWKDQALIKAVCEYSLCTERVAELQLLYEFGSFNLSQHERVLKVMPYFIRLLANDLLS